MPPPSLTASRTTLRGRPTWGSSGSLASGLPFLAALTSWASLAFLTAGCGDVQFVPSPFTPQDVRILYSAQEDVSILRWRVDAAPPVGSTRFELLGPNGYEGVDFSRSVYPGGLAPCSDGKGGCGQLVLRGEYEAPAETRPLRAVHDRYGVLPGGRAAVRNVATTFDIDAFFGARNEVVYVNMEDAVADDDPFLFPRTYERAMWATNGLCVSDFLPSGVEFSPFDATAGFAPLEPLSENGTYCVASRPVPSDGGTASIAQVRVATLPVTETRPHVYRPPVELSPILYQIILDLEIPVPDLCAAAIPRIEETVRHYLSQAGVPVIQLPTLNLAERPGSACAQNNERIVPAVEIADAAKTVIVGRPEKRHQLHLFYFNNLDAPLPAALTQSLGVLFHAVASAPPPGYELLLFSWLFNPGSAALSELYWWKMTNWLASDDPRFDQALAEYAAANLPYHTQVHAEGTPVPLMPEVEVSGHAGHLVKVCTFSPFIQPVSTVPTVRPILDLSWPVRVDDPPAYLVTLPVQIAVPKTSFFEASARVEYQVCARYCVDHPYVSKSRTGVLSWATSPYCADEEAP